MLENNIWNSQQTLNNLFYTVVFGIRNRGPSAATYSLYCKISRKLLTVYTFIVIYTKNSTYQNGEGIVLNIPWI